MVPVQPTLQCGSQDLLVSPPIHGIVWSVPGVRDILHNLSAGIALLAIVYASCCALTIYLIMWWVCLD